MFTPTRRDTQALRQAAKLSELMYLEALGVASLSARRGLQQPRRKPRRKHKHHKLLERVWTPASPEEARQSEALTVVTCCGVSVHRQIADHVGNNRDPVEALSTSKSRVLRSRGLVSQGGVGFRLGRQGLAVPTLDWVLRLISKSVHGESRIGSRLLTRPVVASGPTAWFASKCSATTVALQTCTLAPPTTRGQHR